MGIYLEVLKTNGLRGLIDIVRPGILLELTPEEKVLAEKFKRGIASALGVPPEAVREDVVERWVKAWAKAFIKPEYWEKVGLA